MIVLVYLVLFCVLFVSIDSTNHSCKQFFRNYQNSSQVPLFLIAGVQKAGTTALAAYLSQHPNITLASKKEVHYFDKNSRYSKNISKYYDYFEDCHDNTMILGEATPFYLASKHGCQRIARHFPQAKMIILLREPVSRAYSEYQMKLRRVQEHQSLIQSIQFYAKEVYQCMIKSPINYTRIKKCLPQVIQQHTRYPKLLKAWQKIYQREKSWSKVINQCFQITYPSPIPSSSLLSQRNQSLIPISSVQISPSSASFTSQKPSFFKRSHSSSSLNPSSIQFNATSCWLYYHEGHETIGTIEQSMLFEIQQYQQCIANQSKILSIPLPWVISSSTPFHDRLQALSQLTEECIVIKGGISKDYYYRSLYILQLFRCYQYISPSQFLILPHELLRQQPQETLNRILSFLSLPHMILPTPDTLSDIINTRFEDFEKTTAWRLQSDYKELSIEYEKELRRFFEPYNEMLSELLPEIKYNL